MEDKLKLERKLLETDIKINNLSRILLKKQILKSGSSVEEATLAFTGEPITSYRPKVSRVKAIPKPHAPTSEEVPPLPVKEGSRLDTLRKQNLNRLLEKWEKEQQRQSKEEMISAPMKKSSRKLPEIEVPSSMFPNRYARGELPCTIEHGVKGQYLSWACPLDSLDYEYYLPLFFDGIRVKTTPCSFLARQGIEDLLFAAKGRPEVIIPCLKNLARPLKQALLLYDTGVLLAVLKALRQIVEVDDSLAEHVLQYSKIFLSPLALFLDKNKNTGDRMDYGQLSRVDVGEEVGYIIHVYCASIDSRCGLRWSYSRRREDRMPCA